MTREEQISNGFTEMMKGFWGNQDLKVPDFEEPCKQEPCEDCISKQPIPTKEECLAFYKELTKLANVRFVPYYKMAIKALEQEPKTGHWIIIDDCEKFIAKCSECGRIEDSRMISKYPYCHCGAKMESEG